MHTVTSEVIKPTPNLRPELGAIVTRCVAEAKARPNADEWQLYGNFKLLLSEAARDDREYERAIRTYCEGAGL